MSTPMRTMVGMMSAINSGRFKPTAPRDEVFSPVGFEVSLKEYFGFTVREAAEVLQADAVLCF